MEETKEAYFELVDQGLKAFKLDNEGGFPIRSEDYGDWQSDVSQLIRCMDNVARKNFLDLVDFSAWPEEDYFAFVWDNKIGYTVILDSDARIEWSSYGELKEELWGFQEKAVDLKNKVEVVKQ